jgi:ribonuclease Z
MHSTSQEAAALAKEANVLKLILTHISSRYSDNPTQLLEEARKIFDNVIVAEDLMELDIPYRDKI